MTDEEYEAAFANYEHLNYHEKVLLVRTVLHEIVGFFGARETLTSIATIRDYVALLPSIQQRQCEMETRMANLRLE